MKAKKIYENINFERGKDPKDSMQIGDIQYRKREKIKEELRKAIKILVYDLKAKKETIKENFDGKSTDIEFRGKYLNKDCIYFLGYNISTEIFNSYYAGFELLGQKGSAVNNYSTIGEAMNTIRLWSSEIKENLNFERGKDPKKSMNIGIESRLENATKSRDWEWDGYKGDEIAPIKEDIIEIINYYGNWIKISELISPRYLQSDARFIGVLDSENGDPTLYEKGMVPPLYKSPEEAIEKTIDLIFDLHGDSPQLENVRESITGKYDFIFDKYHNLYENYMNMNKFLNFERDKDPKKDMQIGLYAKIDFFMDEIQLDPDEYIIREDLSIDVFKDINLVKKGLEELPEYINFNIVYGNFYAGGNPWQSLRGFPKEIKGDLQVNSPSNYIEDGDINPNINKKMIKKRIKVYGKIWI